MSLLCALAVLVPPLVHEIQSLLEEISESDTWTINFEIVGTVGGKIMWSRFPQSFSSQEVNMPSQKISGGFWA